MKKTTFKKILAGAMVMAATAMFVLPAAVSTVSAETIDDLQIDVIAEDVGWGGTLGGMISGIIGIVMGFLGIIAVLIILWGGFIWMTAGGEPDKVEKAKKMIYSGIIGLVIIFAAYAIASFVIDNLGTLTNAS